MNFEMIHRWNSVVKPEDTVYHLGDFALGKPENTSEILSKLNGIKILVIGNHDRSVQFQKNAGWNEVHKELYIEDYGKIVWMNHFPYSSEPSHNPKHVRPKANRNWNIALCGHVHTAFLINKFNCINVGVDLLNFCPQTLRQLIEKSNWSGKITI